MSEILKLICGSYKFPAAIERAKGRIKFLNSPYALKDDIKAMQGAKWHGFDDPPEKVWSIKDCVRNDFQLEWLEGGNPYSWWERPLTQHKYTRPLLPHQKELSDHALTFHYCVLAAATGSGKTLSAIETLERSGHSDWWWVAPKSGLRAVEDEFEKWNLSVSPKMLTYEALRSYMKVYKGNAPKGVVFDESSRLKSCSSQRSQCAQTLADSIRAEHGKDGHVILMSGTPSPKSPVDWWSQAEIAWPGFLREGSVKAFEHRLGIFEKQKKPDGFYWDRLAWLDDSDKCGVCGKHELEHDGDHPWEPSINEVAALYERLKGLVVVKHKEDCLDLPAKHYRTVTCEPSTTVKRVAGLLVEQAPTAIQALTWLRELSDGFQYRNKEVGTKPCPICKGEEIAQWEGSEKVIGPCKQCEGSGRIPKIVREAKQIPCPKETALVDLLEENEDQGRVVIFAGFTGSIDRVRETCLRHKWDVVQVDGRGWKVYSGEQIKKEALKYWQTSENKTVFLAHPQSGGMGLTLTEARMAVFYSNDFNPESRIQAEDRIHRIGTDMNLGATIVDLVHLPTDEKVRDILKDNRKLELLTLGEIRDVFV